METLNIAILSRGLGLYSTQSIFAAARRRGHNVRVIDHLRCHLLMDNGVPGVFYEGDQLTGVDVVIPRVGASATDYGATVIRHFEMMGVYTSTRSDALTMARDKFKCLQYLSLNGLDVPKTCIAVEPGAVPMLVEQIGGTPVVVKMLESTHGAGVMLAESVSIASSMVEVFMKINQQVLLQEFIAEANGSDIRAFVVDGKVVASILRQAAEGEFRSNLHRGAEASMINLSSKEENIVLKASQILGLQVAGVDLLRSNRGPLVMEVNASPGLEGIETTTEIDIAGEIISCAEVGYRRFAEAKMGH